MRSSERFQSFAKRGGSLALVALMVAFFAQIASADASALPSPTSTEIPIAAGAQRLPRQAIPNGPSATIPVTTTNDGGPGSLRQAIANANPGDTITVPAGNYVLRNRELVIEKSLTIAGAGSAVTTINGAGVSRGFNIIGNETELAVTISGLTVTNCVGVFSPLTEATSGAAINSVKTALTLRNDVFKRNSSTAHRFGKIGGGTIEDVFGNLTMIGTTVTENLSSGASAAVFGGAVDLEQGQTVTMEHSTISGNGTRTVEGGVIFAAGARLLAHSTRIISSTFSDNRGEIVGEGEEGLAGFEFGGGILLDASTFISSTNSLLDDTIANNVINAGAGSGLGGGIEIGDFGPIPIHITRTTIDSNTVEGGGSAEGGNFVIGVGEAIFSHSSVLHGVGSAGTENCDPLSEEGIEGRITSEGFNRESTDQCGFHAVGDEVNLG